LDLAEQGAEAEHDKEEQGLVFANMSATESRNIRNFQEN